LLQLGIVANVISYPRHYFTIMAEDRFLSIRRLNTPSA
jgi:hypothetical protein